MLFRSLTLILDPRQLGTTDSFQDEANAFITWLRESPAAPDSEGVQLAGEPERKARLERAERGIAIDDTTWAEIQAAAAKVGA